MERNGVNANETESTSTLDDPRTVRAIYNFKGDNNDELCFKKGDFIIVTQIPSGGWWEGTLHGNTGWFPSNYVEEVDDDSEGSLSARLHEKTPFGSTLNEDSSNEYRNFVFHEIINSETQYVKELEETLKKYLIPLRTLVSESETAVFSPQLKIRKLHVLPDDLCDVVVAAVSEVLAVHRRLLLSLEELKTLSNRERRIGGTFIQMAPTIQNVHLDYCALHVMFVHFIEKQKEDICNFMKKTLNSKDLSNGSVILTSSLSNCFRRLDKYPAVLQELQRYTDEAHCDRGDTQRAVFVYRDIVTLCLQIRRQKEMELEVMLGNVKNWPENEEPIESLGTAIHMGPVCVVQSIESGAELKKDRYLVLFPCHLLLIYVSNEMTSFVFERKFYLKDTTLPRLPDHQSTKDTFDILITLDDCSTGKYVFQCQTVDEVRKWITVMHQCKSQIHRDDSKSQQHTKERNKVRDGVKIATSSSGSFSSSIKGVSDKAKQVKHWPTHRMHPLHQPKCSRNDVPECESSGSKASLCSSSSNLKQNEDMAILKVIEAYYLSGRGRKQTVSGVSESSTALISDEDKLIVENCKGNRAEVEEKTLVDCIYSLQDEVRQMRAEIDYLNDCLKSERKARKKLKSTVDKLCTHLNSI